MKNIKITCILFLAFSHVFVLAQEPKDTTSIKSEKTTIKDTVSIVGVGDIMMGSNYGSGMLPPDDGAGLLNDVESILKDSDVTFGKAMARTVLHLVEVFQTARIRELVERGDAPIGMRAVGPTHEVRADEPGSARHEYVNHRGDPLSRKGPERRRERPDAG